MPSLFEATSFWNDATLGEHVAARSPGGRARSSSNLAAPTHTSREAYYAANNETAPFTGPGFHA